MKTILVTECLREKPNSAALGAFNLAISNGKSKSMASSLASDATKGGKSDGVDTNPTLKQADKYMNLYKSAKESLSKYMGSKPLKELKKDPKFIELTNDVKYYKKLWYDSNAAAIYEGRNVKKQTLLN